MVPHDLDLKTLRLFVAVCEHRSIRVAAEREHIEPSAISKRLARLEADVGASLLARGPRGVEPTPAGEAVLEHARTMQYTAQRIAADVAAFNGGLDGHVRIVASVSAIAESLLDDLARFMHDAAHRGIRVDLEERISRDVIRIVRDGSAALGVCWEHDDFQGLEHRPYRVDELVLAVPDGHPLAARKRIAFAETLDHEQVGLPPVTAIHGILQRAAARVGRRVDYRVVVSGFDAVPRIVAARLAIAVVPHELSRLYAQAGRIRTVPLSDAWARRRFVVCARPADVLSPAARRLADFLVERAAAHA